MTISEIEDIKEAVLRLAEIVDALAWRISSGEERENINIVAEIRKILDT